MEYLDILIKLRKIIRSINLESKRIEKQFGVSIPQLLILQFLFKQKHSSAKDIKQHINLNASTVSGIITRLEGKGLIERLPHPKDRRATHIFLTDKGKELLKNSPTTLQEKLSQRLKQLSPKQIKDLDEHIKLLTHIMDAEDLDAAPLVTIQEMLDDDTTTG